MSSGIEIVRQRQCVIRRELDRRGIALKAVSFDSGIPYPTLLTYFPEQGAREPATMPVSALFQLLDGNAIPDDLLSLMLPTGRLIVRAPESCEHDEIEAACRDYLALKGAAHRADSPAGPALADCETESLNSQLAHLRAVAS